LLQSLDVNNIRYDGQLLGIPDEVKNFVVVSVEDVDLGAVEVGSKSVNRSATGTSSSNDQARDRTFLGPTARFIALFKKTSSDTEPVGISADSLTRVARLVVNVVTSSNSSSQLVQPVQLGHDGVFVRHGHNETSCCVFFGEFV
jgi:hypothetical protein